MRDYLAAIRERVVVFDGSMGATLEQYDLTPADYGGLQGKCHEALVLHRPDVIEALHAAMVEVGAEVVQTDSFQASRLKLDEWGLGEHTLEINRKAAEIARKAAGEQRFVAGSIGPTGHLPASDDPTLGKITFRELVAVFEEQARGLVQGGADLLIIETAQDILEVRPRSSARARHSRRWAAWCRSRPASRSCPTAARCSWVPTSARCSPRSRR
jgi:5-methyltetrahydrofolate--homocysteine methyltransferase